MIINWRTFTEMHPLPDSFDQAGLQGHYTNGKDLYAVLALAQRRQPKKVCEIGTGYGETAAHLDRLLPNSRIFSYDVCLELGGYDRRSRFAAREVKSETEVGKACIGTRAIPTIANGQYLPALIRAVTPYDFIFIDGDKTWREIADKTILALECASDDAVIVWSGYWYYCPEIGHYIDLVNERSGNLIAHVLDTMICFTPLNADVKARLIAETADL